MQLSIKKSGSQGSGVFAEVDFKKSELVFDFTGETVKWPRATFRSLQIGKNKFINPARVSFGAFLNHSCNPNCGIKDSNKVTAMRNIKKGEEITIDYSTTVGTEKWDMECLCNSKNCRKLIKPYKFLPERLKEKNGKWTSDYLKNKALFTTNPI